MKTNSSNPVRYAIVAALALGAFTASVLAGPGPQCWNKSPAAAPSEKTTPVAKGKCEGCKTTPKWVISGRGPGGKGVPGPVVVGKTHECKDCTGASVTEKGKVKDTMAHSQACAPLLCCK